MSTCCRSSAPPCPQLSSWRLGLATHLAVGCFLVSMLHGQYVWTGYSDANWSNIDNWSEGIPAENPATIAIYFDSGSTLFRSTSNVDAPWTIYGISFLNGTGALTLTGLQLSTGSGGFANDDTAAKSVQNAILLTADQTWSANNGALTFSGAIANGGHTLTAATQAGRAITLGSFSGSGALQKSGSGTLTLAGDATHTGGTVIQAGTLRVGAGGTSGSLDGSATVDGGATLAFDRSDASAFAGTTSGSGAVAKAGGGTLTVTGALAHTGGTTVSAGTLQIGAGGTAGSITGPVVVESGATFVHNRADAATFSPAISGAGGFGKAGAGTLTLTGNNTFAGTTTVTGGFLDYAGPSSTGTGAITLAGGGLSVDATAGISQLSNRVLTLGAGGGTIDVRNGFLTLFNQNTSPLTGPGGLTKTGAGTLTLTGWASYAGETRVEAGTLEITNGHRSLAYGPSWPTVEGGLGGGYYVAPGAILKLIGASSATSRWGGELAGAGTVAVQGVRAAVRFNSARPFDGRFEITNGGMLAFSPNTGAAVGEHDGFGAPPSSLQPAFFSLNGGTLAQIGLAGTLHANRGITLGAAGGTIDVSDLTLPGVITGAGALTIRGTEGASRATLTGVNTYMGGTVIHGAKVVIDSLSALGQGNGVLLGEGGVLAPTGALAIPSTTTFLLGAGGGGIEVAEGRTVAVAGDSFLDSLHGSTPRLAKLGAGTLVVAGTLAHGQTQVAAGTLQIGAGGGSGTIGGHAAQVEVNSGAHLVINRSDNVTMSFGLTGAGSFTKVGSNTLTYAGAGGDFSGTVNIPNGVLVVDTGEGSGILAGHFNIGAGAELVGRGALVLLGTSGAGALRHSAGNLFLGPNANHTGGTVVDSNASLWIVQGQGLSSQVDLAGTLRADIGASSTAFVSGVVSGSGAVLKSGQGDLEITGALGHTGGTTVTRGTLRVTGQISGGPTTVSSGATIAGTGIVGALTLNSGSFLAPGASPGTLHAGSTTWAGGATYLWEVNNATGAAGSAWDLLAVTGSLAITATNANRFTLDLTTLTAGNLPGPAANFDPALSYTFLIASTTAGVSGFSADAFALDTSGIANAFAGTWSVSSDGSSIFLNYAASAIPEPSTYATLAGLAALGLAEWRRRRAVA